MATPPTLDGPLVENRIHDPQKAPGIYGCMSDPGADRFGSKMASMSHQSADEGAKKPPHVRSKVGTEHTLRSDPYAHTPAQLQRREFEGPPDENFESSLPRCSKGASRGRMSDQECALKSTKNSLPNHNAYGIGAKSHGRKRPKSGISDRTYNRVCRGPPKTRSRHVIFGECNVWWLCSLPSLHVFSATATGTLEPFGGSNKGLKATD
ncbi:hypothetical protein C8R44DRAFT_849150 [Mycena epipterygia]|nr:hypothetical protein C8R44DRAFT_849150 [Mycena epipterygia]